MPCQKVTLCMHNQVKEYSFQNNLGFFQENGFEIITVRGELPNLEDILSGIQSEELKITMDCTSMPQHWYYEIFSWFAEDNRLTSAHLRLVYTMAAYVEEGSALKVRKVREFLKVKTNIRGRKRALILGLGQETGVSESICRIVKPDLLYLFYADPPVEKQFVEKVFVNNHPVINDISIRNLISYPVFNGQIIYQTLTDVILPLRNEYSITIIPQGPKIFSVASMLLQMGYPDMVLSYPVLKKAPLKDRMPSGDPVILDILFELEE
ncbi:MAG: hypothetical protein R6W31_08950 [Bacteroidales bacterium]